MRAPWLTLRAFGLPLGLPDASLPRPSPGELGRALRAALAEPVKDGRERDALAAFILAWDSHFPSSFRAVLGHDEAAARAWARASMTDRGRYLKLRRIAVAHLATVF